jgi:hypothetical protein
MTSALVVYESLFGDARTIARAIAEGLAGSMPAQAVSAGEAPVTIGADTGLLVVGGPNHATGMPRPATRKGAARDHADLHLESFDAGLREWLDAVRIDVPDLPAAAFDTRMEHPRLVVAMDHAARTEEKLLTRLHCRIVAPAEHFSVTTAEGPLAAGEEERARQWGTALGRQVGARTPAGG